MVERLTATRLRSWLAEYRYDLTDEDSIQRGIAEALRVAGIEFEREARLDSNDRPDFFVDGVAIEVKRHGRLGELLRQLSRYAQHDSVRELLVVTARLQSTDVPSHLNSKPLEVLVLLGSVF